jgi:hypothetical protein
MSKKRKQPKKQKPQPQPLRSKVVHSSSSPFGSMGDCRVCGEEAKRGVESKTRGHVCWDCVGWITKSNGSKPSEISV